MKPDDHISVTTICDGENEDYNECGSACGDDTCDDFWKLKICTDNCVPGCYCREGYVRHTGVCIQKQQCKRGK